MKDGIRKFLTEQFGADDALHADLYSQYRAEINQIADALAPLLAGGDVAELGERGHAMKGMALAMGDAEVSALCLELQKAGRGGDAAGCARLVPQIVCAARALDAE